MNELSVAQFPDSYASAVFAKDVSALLALYDDGVLIFDLWSVWSHEGADVWRGSVTAWFDSLGNQRIGVDFDDVQVDTGQDLSTLHAIITYRDIGVDGLELASMQNRLTWILKRTSAGWKIVHEHTSAPVDFDTMTVMLQRS